METNRRMLAELLDEVPGLRDTYGEHVEDYDEILPHVLMADIQRFVTAALTGPPAAKSDARAILSFLEAQFVAGEDDVRNVISVSFLELLPSREERPDVFAALGSALSAEARHWHG